MPAVPRVLAAQLPAALPAWHTGSIDSRPLTRPSICLLACPCCPAAATTVCCAELQANSYHVQEIERLMHTAGLLAAGTTDALLRSVRAFRPPPMSSWSTCRQTAGPRPGSCSASRMRHGPLRRQGQQRWLRAGDGGSCSCSSSPGDAEWAADPTTPSCVPAHHLPPTHALAAAANTAPPAVYCPAAVARCRIGGTREGVHHPPTGAPRWLLLCARQLSAPLIGLTEVCAGAPLAASLSARPLLLQLEPAGTSAGANWFV